MKKRPLILIFLVIFALFAAGCFSKAANETKVVEVDKTTGASAKESEGKPSESGTNEDKEPVDESATPASSDGKFIVNEPSEGQLVKSGGKLTIKGKTRVQEFNVEVEDGHEVLGTAHVSVPVKSEELTEFEAEIEIGEHTSPSGMIIFVTEDEAGGRQEELLLPIKFE